MLKDIRDRQRRLVLLERELRSSEAQNRLAFKRWKQKQFGNPTSLIWFFAMGALVGADRKPSAERKTATSVHDILRTGLLSWRLLSGGP